MKKLVYLRIFVVILFINGCAYSRPPVYEGPFLVPAEYAVPGVPLDVQYADYWIRTASDPDELILSHEEIEHFNNDNPLNGTYIIDVLNLPREIDGTGIRENIAENARYLINAELYVTADIPFETADRHRIAALMDTSGVLEVIPLKFGVMLRHEMGKNWPTTIPLMSEPGDNEFDSGVVSTIDMGEPVALLHTSKDGLWSYVQTYGFTCWIHSDAVAFGDVKIAKELTDRTMPVVAISHRMSVYGTPEGGAAVGAVQMGSYLPVTAAGNDFYEVMIPSRGMNNELAAGRGYVRRSSDVSLGFLPYTLRNVYRQCFTLFGRRYGWGGMFEERDCSAYVMDVFKCFGFKLPRNSSKLLQASQCVFQLDEYDREARLDLLEATPGGITLLGWSGHIMIYLGNILGTPYVIQSTWAAREPVGEGLDVVHRLARILVSDLLLDEGSQKGARIDRLTHITILGNYTFKNQ